MVTKCPKGYYRCYLLILIVLIEITTLLILLMYNIIIIITIHFIVYSLIAESQKMKNQLKNLEKKINDLKVIFQFIKYNNCITIIVLYIACHT